MVSRRHRQALLNVFTISSVLVTLFLFYHVHPFASKDKPEHEPWQRDETGAKNDVEVKNEVPEINRISFTDSNGTKNEIQPGSRMTTEKEMKGTTTEGESISDSILYTLDQTDPRLISYIRRHHLTPPSKLKYNMTHNGLHANSYSDYVRRQLFSKKGSGYKGTFVEAGAYDGEVASNSLFLEEHGWTGLLVECNPLLLPKLMAKNRKAWIANVCLSTTNTPKLMNFSTLSEWPASAKLGRPLNEIEMKKHGIDWVSNKTWINYQIPCFPLYSILKATGEMPEVDFLSLDVEGAEIDILKRIPYGQMKIKTMIVEVHTFNEEEKADLRGFIGKQGYALKRKLDNDDVYVLANESDFS